ncbi:transaldolase family protein [Streptomyces sp. NPDC056149]|uniref:transaldolase family protein n=1 Tax=unclassified Streptomyces TaxID=2593676 RepID=UPI002380E308|nr:transaldolase family protein [Streptomyces sp. WZ-12]
MSILLIDSADPADVKEAVASGLVTSVTTNPKLMRAVTDKPLEHLATLLALVPGEVCYQPTGAYGDDLVAEARRAVDLDPERVAIKAMATASGTALAHAVRQRGARVALTAAQAPRAMITALALGCNAVIPYHDRGLKDPQVSDPLVAGLVAVRGSRPAPLVVAASVKTPEQVAEVLRQGADGVTVPLAVLRDLVSHPSSVTAEEDFLAQYRGGAGAAS